MNRRAPNPNQAELTFFEVPAVPRSDSGGLDIALAVREGPPDRPAQEHTGHRDGPPDIRSIETTGR